MKLFLKIAVVVVLVFAVALGGFAFYMTRGLGSGAELEVGKINLEKVNDGVYTGTYDAGRWTNELKVTVKDHRITKIEVANDVTFPKPEWTDEMFKKVIEKQNTDIDVVSGATVTSKAYLKSVENALKK